MFKPNIVQRIVHRISINMRPIMAGVKRRRLNNTDFTIISNNCWGGVCYEAYGLRKNSPTIGGYFFAEDYLRFIQKLRYYTALDLKIISVNESKHRDRIIEKGNKDAYVGVLDDVEIVFIHYPSANVVKEKWIRRVKRVNWNNLIFKFSMQNDCSLKDIECFDNLDLPGKKICFVNKPDMPYKSAIYYHGFEDEEQVYNDTFYWNRYFDVTAFLNSMGDE